MFYVDEYRRKILDPSSGILATVAWRINGKITYAAEGSVSMQEVL